MARGLFVTGTDTGVGKTVVTRAIARAFRRRGLDVRAVKPVESGAARQAGRLVPADAEALRIASGGGSSPDRLCAYCFADPVSPHLAAARSGQAMEAGLILDFISRASATCDLLIAEGAGGLLVPLSERLLYADVIAASGLGLVIVAPNRLGAINTTLLTLEAASRRPIPLAGVVLNRTPEADFGNAQAIRVHGGSRILGEFPTFERDDDDHLAALAEAHIDLDALLEAAGSRR